VRWRGVVLTGLVVAATAWLAATDRLGLYIHPRYFVFTIAMTAIAFVFTVLAAALSPLHDDGHGHGHDDADADGHDHAHAHDDGRAAGARGVLGTIATLAVVAAAAAALIVLPPATLTSVLVSQRDIAAAPVAADDAPVLAGADFASFSVKDWSGLLRSGADPTGRPVSLDGFVLPDPSGSPDVFYLARLVITHCAVDAQPMGVPVYAPGWADRFDEQQWVSVSGAFAANPSPDGADPVAVLPTALTGTSEPEQPYVY